MGQTRLKIRGARDRRRPGLECLETRQLLSTIQPLPASSAYVNSDSSTNFDQVIQASQARTTFGVTGAGENVAVIDTGVDFNNAAFGSGAVGAGNKVVAGVDFTGSSNGILPTWQHGTGVASLIDGANLGVAPGAGIVALRVFGDNNSGSFATIATALEWVETNHAKYNITAVNISVSDGGNYTFNQFASDGGVGQELTTDVKVLDTFNIPVIAASGNSFDGKTQGQGFPSIIPDVISVTATDESSGNATATTDQLASNAQRLGVPYGGIYATKIAAPGVGIKAASGDGTGTTTEDGTSFATPQVTGGVVLLQQMYQQAYGKLPTVAQLTTFLQEGAVQVHDGTTGVTVGRLDILNSLQDLYDQIHPTTPTAPPAMPPTTTTPVSTPTPPPVVVAPVAPVAVPMTEVIFNGSSIGSYPTSQLAKVYSRLFSLVKGPVKTLRIWAPAGSTPDLGTGLPSGTVVTSHPTGLKTTTKKVVTHKPVEVNVKVQAESVGGKQKATTHKKSFFASLFSFV